MDIGHGGITVVMTGHVASSPSRGRVGVAHTHVLAGFDSSPPREITEPETAQGVAVGLAGLAWAVHGCPADDTVVMPCNATGIGRQPFTTPGASGEFRPRAGH